MARPINARFLSQCWPALAVCLATLLAVSVEAQTTGELNIRESAAFAANGIDFAPLGSGSGTFVVDAFAQSGSFATLAGTAGVIADLTGLPVGSPISVPFLTFAAEPTTIVTLTLIEAGVATSASCAAAPTAPQICTPTGSGYTFINVPGRTGGLTSSVSIAFQGTVQRPATPLRTFRATLTSQFPMSYQAALAAMVTGSLDASWSMNLVEAAP